MMQGVPLPGSLLVPTDVMPDPVGMRHVTSDEDPWRDVVHDDVLLAMSVVAASRWFCQLTVLHMRTGRLLVTNEVTLKWLKEA